MKVKCMMLVKVITEISCINDLLQNQAMPHQERFQIDLIKFFPDTSMLVTDVGDGLDYFAFDQHSKDVTNITVTNFPS